MTLVAAMPTFRMVAHPLAHGKFKQPLQCPRFAHPPSTKRPARHRSARRLHQSGARTWLQNWSHVAPSPMGTATLRLGLASLTDTNTRRDASCGSKKSREGVERRRLAGTATQPQQLIRRLPAIVWFGPKVLAPSPCRSASRPGLWSLKPPP